MPIITKLAVDVDWDAELTALLAAERGDAVYQALEPVLALAPPRRRRSGWVMALAAVATAAAFGRRR